MRAGRWKGGAEGASGTKGVEWTKERARLGPKQREGQRGGGNSGASPFGPIEDHMRWCPAVSLTVRSVALALH